MKKYLSRKFILTALGVASGIAAAISGAGGTVGTVAGLIVTVISTVTYVIAEGKIDAAAVKSTVNTAEQVIELIEKVKKGAKNE